MNDLHFVRSMMFVLYFKVILPSNIQYLFNLSGNSLYKSVDLFVRRTIACFIETQT